MDWIQKSFEQLTVHELYTILKNRVLVFVVEQNCPYPEIDDYDQKATHLYLQEDGDLVAYCRLLPGGTKYKEASIGRVLVKQDYRNRGLAHELMKKAVFIMVNDWKETTIKLQAQSHLQNFYSKHGFRVISDEYLEDGIPHVDMIYKLDD
jgi:ElaA protein